MKTGWESMWVGSIIYFIRFSSCSTRRSCCRGNPYGEALRLMALAAVGTLFICGGIQGYQAGIGDLRRAGVFEWPIRVMLVVGGFVLATPGGGISPLAQWQMTGLGLALLVPTAALALFFVRRAAPHEAR